MAASNGNRRRLRRVAAQLDAELGRDRSRTVHDFGDGWRIVRVRRLRDQQREGLLLRHCLAWDDQPRPHIYSLRDPEALPHATFTLRRLPRGDWDWLRDAFAGRRFLLIVADRVVLVVDRPERLTAAYRLRLEQFAQIAQPRGLPWLEDPAELPFAIGGHFSIPRSDWVRRWRLVWGDLPRLRPAVAR